MNYREVFRKKLESLKEIQNGEWFTEVIKRVLGEPPSNADYFLRKYPALDRERIAQRLVKVASHKAGISGAAAASAVTTAELASLETAGATLAVGVTSFVAEVSFTTRIQLRMVSDIFTILDAPFDLNDPEDILTMFWYAFGVNKYENLTNMGLKVGPRTAEYIGRKALRSGVRAALQTVAARMGGQKLARKITERAMLKLIVPGINLPIAYGANYWFTGKLGKMAIKQAKKRSAALVPLRALKLEKRVYQLNALPTVYHIGIGQSEEVVAPDVIEMQDILTRHLSVTEDEGLYLEKCIEMKFDEFLGVFPHQRNPIVNQPIYEIGSVSHVLANGTPASRSRLNMLAQALSVDVNEERLRSLRKEFGMRS